MMSRPLRILHVATHEGIYRGGAVQLCRMARGQAAEGHRVTVIVNDPRNKRARERERDQRGWLDLQDKGISVSFQDYTGLRGDFLKFVTYVWLHNFDIVHAHRDEALVASERALRHWPRGILIAQRGTVSRPKRRVRKVFACERVKAVVAVSEAVRDAINEAVPETAEKTCVIYGSVDLERFKPRIPRHDLLERLNIRPGTKIIGSLSAYRKAKGFQYLMPALARVMQRREHVEAVFLGVKVPEKVRPLAEELGIADRCHFLGHQPDVEQWLSVMDFTVVAATEREGLSGVLRESLAMEVPVISTDCAGNREIVRDRQTGLLIPPADSAALADAMEWALDHPAEMKTMAGRGRRWVEDYCSLQAQTANLAAVYQALLRREELPAVSPLHSSQS